MNRRVGTIGLAAVAAVSLSVAIAWPLMGASNAPVAQPEPTATESATPTPTATPVVNEEGPSGDLPACATEDSDNCYWDASTMGNGRGNSFVTIDGKTYYEEGPSAETPEQDAAVEGTDVWVPPCTDWLADHGGICQGEPIEWGFSSGDTLVCGQGAKPALDQRSDGIGWWAYCEPALVQP